MNYRNNSKEQIEYEPIEEPGWYVAKMINCSGRMKPLKKGGEAYLFTGEFELDDGRIVPWVAWLGDNIKKNDWTLLTLKNCGYEDPYDLKGFNEKSVRVYVEDQPDYRGILAPSVLQVRPMDFVPNGPPKNAKYGMDLRSRFKCSLDIIQEAPSPEAPAAPKKAVHRQKYIPQPSAEDVFGDDNINF